MRQDKPAAGWPRDAWLCWLEQGARGGIHLGLDRVERVLGRLKLPPCPTLTVAGTNGKGSCAHFAAQLGQSLGWRVGLYTSPHLCRFNERIRVNGQPLADASIAEALWAVECQRHGEPLTYFEMTTLAALEAFARNGVDLRILEVGLGGRLDAVNAVDAEACVITSIGRDHERELGTDLDGIAREKAGVARRGRPAILAMADPPSALLEALHGHGADIRALPPGMASDWSLEGLVPEHAGPAAPLPRPGLEGMAVHANMAAAVAGLQALGASPQALARRLPEAIAGFALPGRQQQHRGLLLDVAHNAEAAAELCRVVQARRAASGGGCRLVLGMLSDKPVEAFVSALKPVVESVHCATLAPRRGLDAAALAARVRSTGLAVDAECPTVAEAIGDARRQSAAQDCILVTGSFLTVAEALCR